MKSILKTIVIMLITYGIFAIAQYDININNWNPETIGCCAFIIIAEWFVCFVNLVLNESE